MQVAPQAFAAITEARRLVGPTPIPASTMESHSADGWAIKSYLPRSLPPTRGFRARPRQGKYSDRGGGERLNVPYTDFAGAPRGCGGLLHHPFHESLVNLVPSVECATPGLGVLAANGTETLNVANPKNPAARRRGAPPLL